RGLLTSGIRHSKSKVQGPRSKVQGSKFKVQELEKQFSIGNRKSKIGNRSPLITHFLQSLAPNTMPISDWRLPTKKPFRVLVTSGTRHLAPHTYSYRSATIGSTFAARLAGR